MLVRMTMVALTLASAVSAQSANPVEGREIYLTYCAQCHGLAAKGNGPMAVALATTPPDLTGLSARNGGVFPIESVATQIDGRAPILEHGGEMPLFGPVFESDQNVALPLPSGQPMLMGQPLADLVVYLQALQVE